MPSRWRLVRRPRQHAPRSVEPCPRAPAGELLTSEQQSSPSTPARSFDALILGGGPAGSACARVLVKAGLSVAIVDREQFPRVKLCGGWLSPPVWDVLGLTPREYPGGLWPWKRCHVEYGGKLHTLGAHGYFIRRYEFDDFLLRRSGAEVIRHSARHVERRDGQWILDDRYRAPILVGAAGTHCPVARQVFPGKRRVPVAAQEHEFLAGGSAVARSRVGRDGEPELLLHEDLGGYSWNVPKGDWLNVGTGTAEPREVRGAWALARAFFEREGHLPEGADSALEQAKGHSYYLFDPARLAGSERGGALLVGDALGLAHPLTAEGILPAVLSGRLAGEALSAGTSSAYPALLGNHPVMRDYALAHELLVAGIALKHRFGNGSRRIAIPERLSRLGAAGTARAFAWMFSGRPIPHAGILRLMLRRLRLSPESSHE